MEYAARFTTATIWVLDLTWDAVNDVVTGSLAMEDSFCKALTDICAGKEKLVSINKEKPKNHPIVEERCRRDKKATGSELCRSAWIIENKFNAICFIINETIIFDYINKKLWI